MRSASEFVPCAAHTIPRTISEQLVAIKPTMRHHKFAPVYSEMKANANVLSSDAYAALTTRIMEATNEHGGIEEHMSVITGADAIPGPTEFRQMSMTLHSNMTMCSETDHSTTRGGGFLQAVVHCLNPLTPWDMDEGVPR